MSHTIIANLTSELDIAHQIVDTIVLRSKAGGVFTIEVGESLLSAANTHGAKVTQVGQTNRHIGICHGNSVDEVVAAAQQLVCDAITGVTKTPIPKPHHQPSAKVSN